MFCAMFRSWCCSRTHLWRSLPCLESGTDADNDDDDNYSGGGGGGDNDGDDEDDDDEDEEGGDGNGDDNGDDNDFCSPHTVRSFVSFVECPISPSTNDCLD